MYTSIEQDTATCKSKIWNHLLTFLSLWFYQAGIKGLRSIYGVYRIMRIYTHAWEDQFVLTKLATQIFKKKKKSINLRLFFCTCLRSLWHCIFKFSIVVKFIFERYSSLLNDYCWNYKLTSINCNSKYRVYRACSQSLALFGNVFQNHLS